MKILDTEIVEIMIRFHEQNHTMLSRNLSLASRYEKQIAILQEWAIRHVGSVSYESMSEMSDLLGGLVVLQAEHLEAVAYLFELSARFIDKFLGAFKNE